MRTKMWLAMGVIAVVSLPLRADDKAQGADKLVGKWTVVSEEKDGKQVAADQIQGKQVAITKDTITCTGKDGKNEMVARYEVDTGAKPWRVVINHTEGEHKGKASKGIMQLDGDNLRVAFSDPGQDAPADFKTKENQCSVTLKRAER